MTTKSGAPTERVFPEGSILDVENCLICQLEDAEEAAVVFRDDLWACEITPGFEVPGWFVLRARRHALGWHDLETGELRSFGQHAKDLVDSVTAVFGSPATYVLNFGEAYPHFHCLIAARGNDVPPEKRTSNIMSLRTERLDRARSLSFVPAVRDAYARVNRS
jgi:diadenosine tetraphosphate (Ap4A) HIT family hydrolase